MSQFTMNWVTDDRLTGSHNSAPELFAGPYFGPEGHPACEGGQFPDPATTSSCPVLSRATWTGLIGINVGSVVHTPVTLAWLQTIGMNESRKTGKRKSSEHEEARFMNHLVRFNSPAET